MIVVDGDRVSVAGKRFFSCIAMDAFLDALAEKVSFNDAAWKNHERMFVPEGPLRKPPADEPLITNVLYERVQSFIDSNSLVVAETGDSWFNCLKLKLPEGCGYEFQMQYGSIGWSVGATLGAAAAAAGTASPETLAGTTRRRVLASIGDGSFQMTAQDVSTMMRYRLNPVIILVNNAVSLFFSSFFSWSWFFPPFFVFFDLIFSLCHFFLSFSSSPFENNACRATPSRSRSTTAPTTSSPTGTTWA